MNKKLCIIAISILSLSLVACNNKDDKNMSMDNNHMHNMNHMNHMKCTADNSIYLDESPLENLIIEITNFDPSVSGSSLKTAQILSDILNYGNEFFISEKNSKDIVEKEKSKIKNLKNYNITVSNLKIYGDDYFNNRNNIDKLISDAGVSINSEHINKEQFNKIINILNTK